MKYLVFAFIFLMPSWLFSQCTTCVPDPGCTSSDGFPTICPLELPPATAGSFYEQALTFFLPAQINDPESGITADLLQLTVNSVQGLPFGMEYTLDDVDGVYFPMDGQNSGCATLCGTPVLPGVYSVTISVTALVSALGFELEQNENFILPLIVEEGEGGTESFTIGSLAACGALQTEVEATLSGVPPQVTTYTWDLGNGQVATGPGPLMLSYPEPGTYPVSLNTVISNPVLSSLDLTSLAGGWGGDADEFFGLGNPDPYFELQDGSNVVVYTSATIDNVTTGSWADIDITLLNPPYTLFFYDEDLVTENDALGSATLNVQPGTVSFSSGNGSNGTASVLLVEVNNITSQVEVNVFPEADPTFTVNGNGFACNAPGQALYVWYRNGIPLTEPLACEFTPTEGGLYQLEATNEFGCTAISESFLYCPPIVPVFNPVSNVISVPAGFESYEWFYNGLPLTGADGPEIPDPQPGNYGVMITTDYGCSTTSTVITVTVGVEEVNGVGWALFPNPADEFLEIRFTAVDEADVWVYTTLGELVATGRMEEGSCRLDVSALSSGYYVVRVGGRNTVVQRAVVIR